MTHPSHRFVPHVCVAAAIVCVCFPSRAQAWQRTINDENTEVTLSVTSAAEPVPSLKHQFVPRFTEQVTGNAAQFYYRAILMQSNLPDQVHKDHAENSDAWLEQPLTGRRKESLNAWLANYDPILNELEKASLRADCDWDLGVREMSGSELYQLLLPEAGEMRALARFLEFKARLEIAEGRYDDAIHTLRLGYTLARASAAQPTMINALVGVAIAALMNEQLENLIAAADSPNMYWAIASLPRPMVDMRQSLRQEMAFPLQTFPFLKDATTANRSPDEWRRTIIDTFRQLSEFGAPGIDADSEWLGEIGVTAIMLKAYPTAKRILIEQGYAADKVEAMPVAQAVAVCQARIFEQKYHDLFKWALIPHAEAKEHLAKSVEVGEEPIPIASLFLPAVNAAVQARIRVDRQFAALRTIEAIRDFAACNDGRLPKSLDDLTNLPAANDPIDGEPFSYEVDGDTAILKVDASPELTRLGQRTYKITIK